MSLKKNIFKRASGLILLALTFFKTVEAQNIKSISGANSPQDDTNPVWLDERTILFTRAFHPSNKGGKSDSGDIWMIQKSTSGEWQKATHRPDLSTNGFDIALGLENPNVLLIYHQESGKAIVYQYSKIGDLFKRNRVIILPDLEEFEGPVTGRVSTDGKVIFWSGKGKNSIGNEDLYFSEKTSSGDWTAPSNLGPVINTQGQELGAFFDVKTQYLFFSSNMHKGAKGKDIFISKRVDDKWTSWTVPVKWEQVSTEGSDISLAFSPNQEVIWTSIQNSDGFADLVTFAKETPLYFPEESEPSNQNNLPDSNGDLTENKSTSPKAIYPMITIGKPEINFQKVEKAAVENYINLLVVDSQTGDRLDFSLSYGATKNKIENEIYSSFLISELISKGGQFIKVTANDYLEKILTIEEVKNMKMARVELVKIGFGNSILLDNLAFVRGTADLEGEQSKANLLKLADFLLQNPILKIRINGHTDNIGDPVLNKSLSLQRAATVRRFLIEQGIDPDHLRTSGWGGTRPIASNDSEEGRAKNRRVEIQIEK